MSTNGTTPSPLRQGAAIGGWICFILGALIMYVSVWTFVLYVPLFFVAFVLSITAMAQRRIALGLILLLATIILPTIEWLTLASTRTNKFLDQHGVPKVTVFNRTPAPVEKATLPPTSEIQAVNAGTGSGSAARDHAQSSRNQILDQPISSLHSWQIQIAKTSVLGKNPITEPAFSPDNRRVVFAEAVDNVPYISIYNLEDDSIISRWQPSEAPSVIAWSPDGKKLAYQTGRRTLRIVDIETHNDVSLPLQSDFGLPRDLLIWKAPSTVSCVAEGVLYNVDLDSLQVTRILSPKIDPLLITGTEHPFCRIYDERTGDSADSHFLFIGEKDGTYSHTLTHHVDIVDPFFSTPDCRHLLVSQGGNGFMGIPGTSFGHYILGSRPTPQMTWKIIVDPLSVQNQNEGEFADYIRLHVPFFGQICSPATNPLNGKVIGPSLDHLKGSFQVQRWAKGYAIIRTSQEIAPFETGDVAINIRSAQPAFNTIAMTNSSYKGNPIYGLGRAWSTIEPADASESTKASDSLELEPAQASGPNGESAPSTDDDKMRSLAKAEAPPNEGVHPPATPSVAEASPQEAHNVSPGPLAGERFPDTRLRLLTSKELQKWPSAKLRYAINEMFARRGAEFGDKKISAWFRQFSWYSPQPGLTFDAIESSMPPIERANVKLLGSMRDSQKSVSSQKISSSTPQQFPYAQATNRYDMVISPYPPNNVIQIGNLAAESLVRDPSTGQVFRVPNRPQSATDTSAAPAPGGIVGALIQGVSQALQNPNSGAGSNQNARTSKASRPAPTPSGRRQR